MPNAQAFISLCLELGVLRFGEFKLKSGRQSPYFFNAGLFNTGRAIAELGRFYAGAVASSDIAFDMLFGPAYKGITLASATAVALARLGRNVPFAFNRKEAKDHGEGGTLIGAPLAGRVVIIDDVISAGTSVRESVELIRAQGASPSAVMIALDRQERAGDALQVGELSASQEVARLYGMPVLAIASLDDLLTYLSTADASDAPHRERVAAYRARYGES
jgi:orotate phosphoribosyltransferase